MKIDGVEFEVPKGLAKKIQNSAKIHGWGTITQNDYGKKTSPLQDNEYPIYKSENPVPPNNHPWLILDEETMREKGLKEGDEIGIIGYSVGGRSVLDIFKEKKE